MKDETQEIRTPRKRGRPADPALPERRRSQIIAAATEEFARRGYSETDLGLVADRAGCGKGTLYRYFASKEDLFRAATEGCFRGLQERLLRSVRAAREPLEQARAAVRAFLEYFDEHPEYVEILIQERAQFRDRPEPVYRRLIEEQRGWWKAFAARLIPGGTARKVGIEESMEMSMSLLFGVLFQGGRGGRGGSLAARAGRISESLFRAFGIATTRRRGSPAARAVRAGLLAAALAAAASAPARAADSLEDVLVQVLKDNLAFKMLAHEVLKSDSERLQSREMLAPHVSVEGNFAERRVPQTGMTAFFGNEQYQWDLTTALRKTFMTGTTASLAVHESLLDANDAEFGAPGTGFYKPADPPLHSPVVSLSLRQELLKNGFGYGQRKLDQALENLSVVKRRQLMSQASDLALKLLADYWQVRVDESQVEHAETGLAESRKLLAIATENVRYGKSEEHDLHQFRAMVAMAEVAVARARQALEESRRAFLRMTRVDPSSRLEGVGDLVDERPDLDREEAVRRALQGRADYLNAMLGARSAELGFDREKNDALPGLAVFASLSSMANREVFSTALEDVGGFKYPGWSVGFQVTYPLFNPGSRARVRDAWLAREQAKLNLSRLREEVRDDVLAKLERVDLAHLALTRARSARDESAAYYQALVEKSTQGKFGSFELKQALDGYTAAKQQAFVALVGFNLAVLSYKRAREELFEHYGVTLEGLIRKVAG